MASVDHDMPLGLASKKLVNNGGGVGGASKRALAGVGFGLLSSLLFGMSGTLARGLLESGWSAGAVVTLRVGIGALVLLIPTLLALGGRWSLLRQNTSLVLGYGVLAVAGAQLCYITSVRTLPVAVALLIEFMAPLLVVAFHMLRGHKMHPLTGLGAILSVAGLMLVLGIGSGLKLDTQGVLWALGAMIGCAAYFLFSARESSLPPVVLAGGGLWVATIVLAIAAWLGVLTFETSQTSTHYGDFTLAWWMPMLLLGVGTAALPYLFGIGAGRRLGSRLASFVALSEVLFALMFAWWLLGEQPVAQQVLGGVLVIGGVVAVKLGEPVKS
jgi:drug/metabolite transporter (DMT)-like permease